MPHILAMCHLFLLTLERKLWKIFKKYVHEIEEASDYTKIWGITLVISVEDNKLNIWFVKSDVE